MKVEKRKKNIPAKKNQYVKNCERPTYVPTKKKNLKENA